ncbi:MAG: TonB-dependent receptor, partial [Gammaproteobacteria bacterium]|nr:TonB-dependent receptor [Gammaproteobacteria bacterium]
MNVRSLLFLILLAACSLPATGQTPSQVYEGRTVVSVIENFRSQGWPFAYSTNLVGDDLFVMVEPEGTGALEIVREILGPHGLTLRSEEGLWLIIRSNTAAARTGSLLIIVRDRRDFLPLDDLEISGSPEIAEGILLTAGIRQISEIAAGSYRLQVGAAGYQAVERDVSIRPGQSTELKVELSPERPEIENITVSASRYQLSRDISTSRFDIDQRSIETLPDLGDDPLRATHRLPGAAASGVSARAHFRGGEDSETGIILNGQRLFDPFHVRDYQSIFSTVDSRAIDGVEVYTGGFPVQYGDRLSGVVLMESLDLTRPRHTEIGVSVFNTSFLTAGRNAEGTTDWLFSARRGNLDLVIDSKFGRPRYYDIFSQFSTWLTPDTRLSGNALFADDQVLVVTESDLDEVEKATSQTRNAQFWLALENRWSDTLSSSTVLSISSFSNRRLGLTRDMEKVRSDVSDDREIDQVGIRQDWSWNSRDRHLLQWGFAFEHHKAQYSYKGSAEFFGLRGIFEDVPGTIQRDLAAAPSGPSYSVYVSDKWKVAARTVVQFGLRWDDQGYTGLPSGAQLSPRISVLHGLNPKTELRFSWGRYYQSQGIHELQIEDGLTHFFPAQQADHIIAGISHKFGSEHLLRFEVFQKDMSELRPRFENLYDPLALIPELQPDRVRIAPASARARGLELSLSRAGPALSWWAIYSLAEVTDTVDGLEVPRAWDQRHSLQAGLTWNVNNWDLSVAGHIRSGWPTTSLGLEEVAGPGGEPEFIVITGPRNAAQLPHFSSLDVRISRTFDVGRGRITTFLEVSNLLNRNNICCYDYDLETDANGEEVL